jgi:membrane protein YdbS with pleckstrin-like domain
MRRIPTPITECALVAVIAAGTAWVWLYFTGQHTLTVGAVIACTLVSVVVALVVEAAIRRARRGRPRRAHARAVPPKTRGTV